MKDIPINKKDVIKGVCFIVRLTQSQNGPAMHGALSSKGDLIGGIFDRWVNTFPEAIVFNKGILPDIACGKEAEIVSDFYSYDPRIAGIAPDVIGLKINKTIVPFVVFRNGWEAVNDMPQIEIKTFKKPQKMVSLRNQGYDDKYLVMIESDFRIDYLVPFLKDEIFSDEIYKSMQTNDDEFIVEDVLGVIQHFERVEYNFDEIGKVSILRITNSKNFMDNSTCCEGRVSVQRLDSVELYTGNRVREEMNSPLSKFVLKTQNNLYRYNSSWYDGVGDDGIPYFNRAGNTHKTRVLDFSCQNIDSIYIIKRAKTAVYVKSTGLSSINGHILEEGKVYKLIFNTLDRESNDNQEYFLQKELLNYIPDLGPELKRRLKKIIEEN